MVLSVFGSLYWCFALVVRGCFSWVIKPAKQDADNMKMLIRLYGWPEQYEKLRRERGLQ